MRQVAVGQRNSGVGAAPGGRGHPGNHLTIDAMRQQVFEFFRAAAEDERIAALEAHYAQVLLRQIDQQLVDLWLRQAVVAAGLADVVADAAGRQELHQIVAHQAVVDHRVGLLQQAPGAQGEQARIAGASADEGDFARGQRGAECSGENGWLIHANS